MIVSFVFYLFALVLVVAAMMVITARNPVHSVLFLILAFFNAAGLFLLLGAEFLALILVIVYVGAVAVLFLFVVMMLDIDFVRLRSGASEYVPLGIFLAIVLCCELAIAGWAWTMTPLLRENLAAPLMEANVLTNTESLGRIMYTQYVFPFQLAGVILLVAMIGAIVLTHRVRPGVRRQNVAAQNARQRSAAMEIIDIKPGSGA
jgi:NADH-quinone oxidoreductase subunit J